MRSMNCKFGVMPATKKRSRESSTFTERWNEDVLKQIIKMKDTPPDVVTSLRGVVKRMHCGQLQVSYRHSNFTPGEGRLYANGASLQNISSRYRRLLAMDQSYHDIDMSNAYPRVLLYLAATVATPNLKRYVEHREDVLKNLMNEFRVERGIAKKLILLTINFGDYHHAFADNSYVEDSDEAEARLHFDQHNKSTFLEQLKIESNTVFNSLKDSSIYKSLYDACATKCKEKNKKNVAGCFMSHVYFRHEAEILKEMTKVFSAKGYEVGCLIFDGMLIQYKGDKLKKRRVEESKNDGAEEGSKDELDHLARTIKFAETHVQAVLKIPIVLEEKPLEPTDDDRLLLTGEIDLDSMEKFERLVYLLTRDGCLNGYKRRHGMVMREHDNIRGVYVVHMPGTEYINHVLRDDRAFQQDVYIKKLSDWFELQDHSDFELMGPASRTTISFQDAWVDVSNPKSLYWMDDGRRRKECEVLGIEYIESPPTTFHYFDCKIEDLMDDPATPLWDKLVKTQLYDRVYDPEVFDDTDAEFELYKTFQALIGRLFLPVGFDNWQVWPLLKGEGDTGKSTVIDIVKAMFSRGEVASYDSGRQQTFGLEDIYDKRLLLFPDIPKRLDVVLPEDKMCSMVSGESISIPRKNKTALNITWEVPALLAGNHVPSYQDVGGRIARRFVVFNFNTLIKDKDTTLRSRILRDELPKIVLHCLANYHDLLEKVGAGQLRNFLPRAMRETEDEMRTETSPLYNFIVNGDDHYTITHDKTSKVRLEELRKAFQNHVRFTLRREKEVKWTGDHNPIKAAGYEVKRCNMCKVCNAVDPSKGTCDDSKFAVQEKHWEGGKNRKQLYYVVGMKIDKKESTGGAYASCYQRR